MKRAASSKIGMYHQGRREMELECDMLRCAEGLPCDVHIVVPSRAIETLHASFRDDLRRREKV
jgi:hypothetical protein